MIKQAAKAIVAPQDEDLSGFHWRIEEAIEPERDYDDELVMDGDNSTALVLGFDPLEVASPEEQAEIRLQVRESATELSQDLTRAWNQLQDFYRKAPWFGRSGGSVMPNQTMEGVASDLMQGVGGDNLEGVGGG